jgi:hypothetical protein
MWKWIVYVRISKEAVNVRFTVLYQTRLLREREEEESLYEP